MHLLHLAAVGSHLLFTFPPASLACFYVCDGASSTSYNCTRPQGLVYEPRTFPEHQLWFMALKSHFYPDVSEISIFSADYLSWKVFTWVSEKSETQRVWSPQYFLPNCYTQLPLSQLVAPPVFPVAQARSLGVIFRLLLHTLARSPAGPVLKQPGPELLSILSSVKDI